MDRTMTPLLVDVVAATVPMLVLAAVTWRLVWPRWKLLVKLILHPCLYAVMAYYLGHLSVLIAWVHQGLFGLGGHIWFCRRAGFTWYRVEDPERYIAKSKAAVAALQGRAAQKGPPSA